MWNCVEGATIDVCANASKSEQERRATILNLIETLGQMHQAYSPSGIKWSLVLGQEQFQISTYLT